jgi:RNA polymerase sigma-70 factor (ECF subfamily)
MSDEDVAPSPHLDRTQFMPTTDTRTRHSIIDGVRGQGPDRWEEFYAIYKPMLVGYFRKQGLSAGDVQDLVQDVFLKLCKRIQTYDRDRTRFRTWLFTVARNTLIDRARRDQTRRHAVDGWVARVLAQAADDEETQRLEFEKSHHTRILQFAFEKARRRSSERVWDCFEMSVIQGKPGAKVAEALEVSVNVVYVNSWRVLQHVKDLCRRYDEDLKHEPDGRLP